LRLAEAAVLLAFAALFAHLALHAAVLGFGGGRLCGRHGRTVARRAGRSKVPLVTRKQGAGHQTSDLGLRADIVIGKSHTYGLTYADGNSQVHAAHERFQQEAGEPESRRRAALRLLQFLPGAFQFACYSCYGSGNYRSRVGVERIAVRMR
jgi:hypothetical protein